MALTYRERIAEEMFRRLQVAYPSGLKGWKLEFGPDAGGFFGYGGGFADQSKKKITLSLDVLHTRLDVKILTCHEATHALLKSGDHGPLFARKLREVLDRFVGEHEYEIILDEYGNYWYLIPNQEKSDSKHF